ncbi:DUF5715 family protein [Elizabethkingia sp. JS20170427COW]|uniref:DUF5715 family protein n=1 Tax=Elizabethkingia sp. JS20170427COW TaxID=2583851 RepID=UPI0011101DEC|nr:DUF5715 family protein [Elizabethkingia sp. JS20170427COW]QCX53574.1 hypothetical protein FGE20_07430 [Elizabethkingia sp. JS20170427COW]
MKYVLFSVFSLMFGNVYAQKCYSDINQLLKVEVTPLYQAHLDASKGFNISVLENNKHLEKYKKRGKLVSVSSLGKGYRIQKLEYSHKYLIPKAKNTLLNISKRFYKNTNGSTLTYTSLTRTMEDQCRLRKVNSNASIGISSHNYGNSFDISYVRFNDRLKVNTRLEKELEEVLEYYRKKGFLYYIKEKQQSCYHVTVRNY